MSGGRDEHPGLGIDPDEIVIEEVPELDLDIDPEEPTYTELPPPQTAGKQPQRRRMLDRAPPMPGNKSKLAQRASSRPMSAQEALAEARRAEQQKKAMEEADLAAKREQAQRLAQVAKEKAEAEKRKQEERVRREAQEAREAEAQAARDRAAFGPRSGHTGAHSKPVATDPMAAILIENEASALLERMGFEHEVVDTFTEFEPTVVSPMWQAHVVRARHEGDLANLLAAQSVVDALARPSSEVVACRVEFAEREFAVWVDLEREAILACMEPAEVYLVGLS